MSSLLHFDNPNRENWIDIFYRMEKGELKDQTIYKLGQGVFGTRNTSSLPQNGEVLTQRRIAQIIESEQPDQLSISSSSFDPILVSHLTRVHYLESSEGKAWVADFIEFENELDKTLSAMEGNLDETMVRFIAKYKEKYGVSTTDFDALYIGQAPYAREKLLCKVLNKYRNDQETRDFIESKKKEIIVDFAPLSLQNIPNDQLEFLVQYEGEETHNQGKLPAKITFTHHGKELFSVMYKPRGASVDKAVQELLTQLKMPSYKIVSYDNENKSLWQYIDGIDMVIPNDERRTIRYQDPRLKNDGASRAPEAFIKYSTSLKDNQRDVLMAQLERLNRVFLAINISDLHGENVRLGLDGQIYPIDLEVMDERQPTLLMIDDYTQDVDEYRKSAWNEQTDVEYIPIKNWQNTLIDQSHEFTFPVRHVLVNTGELVMLGFTTNIKNAAQLMFNLICQALDKRGYLTTENQKQIIKNKIYLDLLNGDVSFFTEFKNMIYYGYVSEGHVIGNRK